MPQIESDTEAVSRRIANNRIYLPFSLLAFTVVSMMLIMEEKASNIKVTLNMLGLEPMTYWFSWLHARLCVGIPLTVMVTIVWLKKSSGYNVHVYREVFAPWFLLMVLNNITFSIVLSLFLTNARFATVYTLVVYIFWNYLSELTFSSSITVPDFLVGPFLFSHGARLCVDAMFRKDTLYLSKSDTSNEDKRFIEGVLYMTLNSVLNCAVVWVVECRGRGESPMIRFLKKKLPASQQSTNYKFTKTNALFFETSNVSVRPGIEIKDLVKVYGSETVVSGVTLDIYPNEITMLLGHNGAGKTTTISMILGLTPITHGVIKISGADVRTNMTSIRKTLGFCPQYDMFFPRLTAYEQLQFFSRMRNNYTTRGDVLTVLTELGVADKIDIDPINLSGGQRRKLSVASAFAGDTKTIFLDEPSTGLDPGARRDLWKFLTKWKSGRTIVMTTHFMDEAENLSDRIAIMARGVVQCYGSPTFLKKVYGVGYKLTLVKAQNCVEEIVRQHIISTFTKAKFLSSTISEMNFVLHEKGVKSFPKSLNVLEQKMSRLKILSYGLSRTSMEDVFLRVGDERDEVEDEIFSSDQDDAVESPAQTIKMSPQSSQTVKEIDTIGGQEVTLAETGENTLVIQDEVHEETGDAEVVSPSAAQDGILEDSADGPAESNNQIDIGKPMETQDAPIKSINPVIIETNQCAVNTLNHGSALRRQQFQALFIKRWIIIKRNWATFFILMGFSVIIAGLLVWASYTHNQAPPLYFKTDNYREKCVAVRRSSDPAATDIYKSLQALLPSDYHIVELDDSLSFDDSLKAWAREHSAERYTQKILMGFDIASPPQASTVHYQGSYVHSEGVAVNLFLNAYTQSIFGQNISILSGVFSLGQLKSDNSTPIKTLHAIHLSMLLIQILVLSWLSTEKSCGAKHLEMISGKPFWMSYLSNWVFDVSLLLSCTLLMWLVTFVQHTVTFLLQQLPMLAAMHVLYITSVLPLIYTFQIVFKNATTAIFAFLVYNVLTVVAYFVSMIFINRTIGYLGLHIMSVASPNANLGFFHVSLGLSPSLQVTFEMNQNKLLYSSGSTLCFFVIAFFLEYFSIRGFRCKNTGSVIDYITVKVEEKTLRVIENKTLTQCDDDVIAENQRIANTDLHALFESDALILDKVCKKFMVCTRVFTAVEGTSLGIPKNECFGLLGQNGAGKSTTFKMLIGELNNTSGQIYLSGLALGSHKLQIYTMIGYCPQYDYLHGDLTARESLYLFGRFRGIAEQELNAVIEYLITALMLDAHANKQSKFYSLGNKRKLSIALAVIGNPPFVMLDEPTSGMDVIAKRAVWKLLQNVRSLGSTLILTSHSMEECELLCTRLTIMVRGKMMCLGSPQHLKSKYAQGYTVTVKVKDETGGSTSIATDYLKKCFTSAEVFCQMESYLHLQIPSGVVSLPLMFKLMEQAKQDLQLQDYSIQQTTLEQVFLMFMNKNKA
ncbi:ATP-binding cassette sub-family A member 2-like [Physella acuta]|uniref:ATP-binding cassette sub-family A member 2-like n=1 Tax=Physella acuta TaxID=109671 RepID=UPI0027DD94E2|nr:ATP-binding cassette sub-family A member 2-like [Physella acuta]